MWCHVLVGRFAPTTDFSTIEQAVYLISHWHLDLAAMTLGHQFWQDHGAFIAWPERWLQLLWAPPRDSELDEQAPTIGRLVAAIGWILATSPRAVIKRPHPLVPGWIGDHRCRPARDQPLGRVGLLFDVHTEAFGALFVMLAGRGSSNGRRRAWILVILDEQLR